jgi:hypothetical protein
MDAYEGRLTKVVGLKLGIAGWLNRIRVFERMSPCAK